MNKPDSLKFLQSTKNLIIAMFYTSTVLILVSSGALPITGKGGRICCWTGTWVCYRINHLVMWSWGNKYCCCQFLPRQFFFLLLSNHRHEKEICKFYINYFQIGVLNTEELATINTTYSQNEKPSLAGIPEEVRTSGESTTTLDTDNWTLESLESELFDNVRASIQKSLGFSEKDPSPTSGSSEKNRKKAGSNPSRLGCKSCW